MITGTGAAMLKLAAAQGRPLRLTASTAALAVDAIMFADIIAVSFAARTEIVAGTAPVHSAVLPARSLAPSTVSAKSRSPACVEVRRKPAMTGRSLASSRTVAQFAPPELVARTPALPRPVTWIAAGFIAVTVAAGNSSPDDHEVQRFPRSLISNCVKAGRTSLGRQRACRKDRLVLRLRCSIVFSQLIVTTTGAEVPTPGTYTVMLAVPFVVIRLAGTVA